jgi:hypothetical protein
MKATDLICKMEVKMIATLMSCGENQTLFPILNVWFTSSPNDTGHSEYPSPTSLYLCLS